MDLLEAAGLAGLAPRKMANFRGGEFRCACPACGGDGSSDRFLIWPVYKGGRFRCRHCPVHGDTVQLLVDYCGYDFKSAFDAVGQIMPVNHRPAGYKAVTDDRAPAFDPRQCEDPIETWQIKAQEFVDAAHQSLLSYDRGMKYLESRGLDANAVSGFRLGWFAGENGKNCMFRPRSSWGLSVIKHPTTGKNKMLWLPRGFVIPFFRDGKVHRIRIRRPKIDLNTEKNVKYYVVPGSGMGVMTVNPDKPDLVIIEAELDGMMVARKAGSIAGVIALGAAAIKPDAAVFYYLKKARRILVALDHDAAGQAAWKWWKENFSHARLWPVPVGKDPGEAFEQGIDIKAWVTEGLPPAAKIVSFEPGYVIPEGLAPIQELSALLGKYKTIIKADKDRAEIIFPDGLQNRAIRDRIHYLFFEDEEVHWYLRHYHPDTKITGANCGVQKVG